MTEAPYHHPTKLQMYVVPIFIQEVRAVCYHPGTIFPSLI
jgi:hypothetical protein